VNQTICQDRLNTQQTEKATEPSPAWHQS